MVRSRCRRVAGALATSLVLAGCGTSSAEAVDEACRLVTRAQQSVSSVAQQPEESRDLTALSQQLDGAHRAVEDLSSGQRRRLIAQCSSVSTIVAGTNRAAAFSAIAAELLRAEAEFADMRVERNAEETRAREEARTAFEIDNACEAIANARSIEPSEVTTALAGLRDAGRRLQNTWSESVRTEFFTQCDEVSEDDADAVIAVLTEQLIEASRQQQAERQRLAQEQVEQELRRGLDVMQRWWRDTHWAARNIICQGFDQDPARRSASWSAVAGDAAPEHAFVFFTEACNNYMRGYCNHTRSCSGLIDWNARP